MGMLDRSTSSVQQPDASLSPRSPDRRSSPASSCALTVALSGAVWWGLCPVLVTGQIGQTPLPVAFQVHILTSGARQLQVSAQGSTCGPALPRCTGRDGRRFVVQRHLAALAQAGGPICRRFPTFGAVSDGSRQVNLLRGIGVWPATGDALCMGIAGRSNRPRRAPRLPTGRALRSGRRCALVVSALAKALDQSSSVGGHA